MPALHFPWTFVVLLMLVPAMSAVAQPLISVALPSARQYLPPLRVNAPYKAQLAKSMFRTASSSSSGNAAPLVITIAPLPPWLTFDASTMTIATPPGATVPMIDLLVTGGAKVALLAANITATVLPPPPQAQSSAAIDPLRIPITLEPAPTLAIPMASQFADQLNSSPAAATPLARVVVAPNGTPLLYLPAAMPGNAAAPPTTLTLASGTFTSNGTLPITYAVYDASSLAVPEWVAWTPRTRTLTLASVPADEAPGYYRLAVAASNIGGWDGGLTDSLLVKRGNRAPTVTASGGGSLSITASSSGTTPMDFSTSFADPDGDPCTLEWVGGGGHSLDGINIAALAWTLTASSVARPVILSIAARDIASAASTGRVLVRISVGDRAPASLNPSCMSAMALDASATCTSVTAQPLVAATWNISLTTGTNALIVLPTGDTVTNSVLAPGTPNWLSWDAAGSVLTGTPPAAAGSSSSSAPAPSSLTVKLMVATAFGSVLVAPIQVQLDSGANGAGAATSSRSVVAMTVACICATLLLLAVVAVIVYYRPWTRNRRDSKDHWWGSSTHQPMAGTFRPALRVNDGGSGGGSAGIASKGSDGVGMSEYQDTESTPTSPFEINDPHFPRNRPASDGNAVGRQHASIISFTSRSRPASVGPAPYTYPTSAQPDLLPMPELGTGFDSGFARAGDTPPPTRDGFSPAHFAESSSPMAAGSGAASRLSPMINNSSSGSSSTAMIQMGHEQASAVGSGATIRPPNPIATLRQVPTSSSSIAYGPPDMSEQAALAGMMSFEASILNCTALTRKPSDGSAHSGDLADHHRPLHHGNGALLSTTSLHNNNNNGGGGFTPGPRPRPVHGSNHKAPYLHPVAAMDGAPATELAAGGPAGVSHNSNAASAHARFPRNNAVRQELVRKCLAGVEEEKRLMNAASDPGIAANVSLGRIPSNTDDLESPEASEVSDSMSLSGSDEDSVPNGHDRRRAAPPKNVTEELSSSLSSSGCSPCTTSVDGFVIQGGEAARQRRSTLRESLGTSLVVLRSAAPMSPSPQGAAAEGPSPPSSSFSGTTSSSSLAGSSPTTTGSSKSSSGRRTSRLRESISLSPVAEAHDGEVEAATPENASAALDGLLRNYFDDGTTSEAATEMDDSAPPSESCDSAAGTFTPVTEAAMSPTSSMYRMPSSQPATSLQRVDPKKPISQPPNHSTRANTVPVTISPTTARAPMASPPITPTTPTSPSTAMTPAVMCDAAVVRQLVAYATIPFQYVLTLPPPAPRRRSTALASGKSVGLQVRISGGDGPNSGAADSLHRVEIPSTGSSGSSSGRRAAARTTFPNAHFAPSPPALTEALARGKALDVDNGTNPANPDDSPIATGLALMMHHPGAAATQVKFAPPPWIVADVDGTRRTGVLRGTPAAADVGEWGVEVVDLREADPGAARLHEVIVWKAVVRVTAR